MIEDEGTDVTFRECVLEENLASAGGCIYVGSGKVTIVRSVLSGCASTANFGGAIVNSAEMIIRDTAFEGSAAGTYGGDIFTTAGSSLHVRRSVFAGASAGTWGGSLVINSGSTSVVEDSTFRDARANTVGGLARIYTSGTATFRRCSISATTSAEGVFDVDDAGSSLRIEETRIANISQGSAIIDDATGVDFSTQLDLATFDTSNTIPALSSASKVHVQNCDGLTANDTAHASVSACEDPFVETAFCPASSCDAATVGIDCYCRLGGATLTQEPLPAGCMDSGDLLVKVPSSRQMTLVVEKPGNVTQDMVLEFSGGLPGGQPLSFELTTSGIEGLRVSPRRAANAIETSGGTALASVSFASATTFARTEPYTGVVTFAATDGVCKCKRQQLRINITLLVSAKAVASKSRVRLTKAAATSGTLEFEIESYDETGMPLLDAADVAYFADLTQSSASRSRRLAEAGTIAQCRITYELSTRVPRVHTGACKLLTDATGTFELRVTDIVGADVGGAALPVNVSRCDQGLYAGADGDCVVCAS